MQEKRESPKYFLDLANALIFASTNFEKLILYITVGVLLALVLILFITLIQQRCHRKQKEAVTAPTDLYADYEAAMPNKINSNLQHHNDSLRANQHLLVTSETSAASAPLLDYPQNLEHQHHHHRSKKSSGGSSRKKRSSKSSNNTDAVLTPQQYANGRINYKTNLYTSAQLGNDDRDYYVGEDATLNDQKNQAHFESYKLITQKIINGSANDNVSEYEIPIIRYNENSLVQQYAATNSHRMINEV